MFTSGILKGKKGVTVKHSLVRITFFLLSSYGNLARSSPVACCDIIFPARGRSCLSRVTAIVEEMVTGGIAFALHLQLPWSLPRASWKTASTNNPHFFTFFSFRRLFIGDWPSAASRVPHNWPTQMFGVSGITRASGSADHIGWHQRRRARNVLARWEDLGSALGSL